MIIASSAKMSSKHQEHLQQEFPLHTWYFGESLDEALMHAAHSDILITYGEDITEDIIAQFPQLKWIQVISAGVERMPLQALQQKDILVTNARGIHRTPMAEYTLGVMLQHVRRLPEFFGNQKQQHWDRSPRIDELAGKTVGILGAGAIGSEIARKAQAFDMHVIGMNQSGEVVPHFDEMYSFAQMDTILQQSDYVVVILPHTPKTVGIIGERELRLMKPTAVLINIARGTIVSEDALHTALQEQWIEAAYLDVFTAEPLPADHPLWTAPNCWITPHISGRSPHYMARALAIFEQNLHLFTQGEQARMLNFVSASKGY